MKKLPGISHSFSSFSDQDMYTFKEETDEFGNLFQKNI